MVLTNFIVPLGMLITILALSATMLLVEDDINNILNQEDIERRNMKGLSYI